MKSVENITDSALLFTTVNEYVLQTQNILDPSGTIVASKRFEGQAETGQDPYAEDYFFYRYDIRGSVTTIVDGEGAVVKSYDYDEFGVTTSTGDAFFNEVTFTGSIADASGLLYMNARYYNPATARFLSQDTYTGSASDPWTQHLYAYCNNNPVNMIDPTGHVPVYMTLLNDGNNKSTGSWFLDSLVDLSDTILAQAREVVNNYSDDVANFSINNTDEQRVYDAHYFSAYNGTLVFRHSIKGTTSCSIYGVIFLNRDTDTIDKHTLRHEYGHSIQYRLLTDSYGSFTAAQLYTFGVAIPSLINYWRNVPYEEYYSTPWERTADKLGGVNRSLRYTSCSNRMADWYLLFMGATKETGGARKMERRMACNHKREETMKRIVHLSLLLAVLLTSTACELPPYRNVDDGLFTIAANAIPNGYAAHGAANTKVLERDDYGRILFVYTMTAPDDAYYELYALVVCQQRDEKRVAFYEDFCFIVKDGWDTTFDEAMVAALKEQNDWGRPLQAERMIWRDIVQGGKDSARSIGYLESALLAEDIVSGIVGSAWENDAVLSDVDANGKMLLFVRCWPTDVRESTKRYFVMLEPDGSCAGGSCCEEIASVYQYQAQLHAFKEKNGWTFGDRPSAEGQAAH